MLFSSFTPVLLGIDKDGNHGSIQETFELPQIQIPRDTPYYQLPVPSHAPKVLNAFQSYISIADSH